MNYKTLLESIVLPSVTNDQKVVCLNDPTDKQLFDALKGIPSNKISWQWPVKDSFTGKDSFINSIKLLNVT